LTSLNFLNLVNNLLTGSIPSEVEALGAYHFDGGTSEVNLKRISFLNVAIQLYFSVVSMMIHLF